MRRLLATTLAPTCSSEEDPASQIRVINADTVELSDVVVWNVSDLHSYGTIPPATSSDYRRFPEADEKPSGIELTATSVRSRSAPAASLTKSAA